MRAAALLLLATAACSQIFGLESPAIQGDAAIDGRQLGDAPRADGAPDAPAGSVTVTFQQGTGGYVSGADTYIEAGNQNLPHDADSTLRWHLNSRWALIQFAAIFGAAPGRIPQTSTITSATVEIYMNQVNCTGSVRDVEIAWADTDTYATFGTSPGVDATDVSAAVVNPTPTLPGIQSIDVTSSVQKWRVDVLSNHGWILVGDSGNDCIARSNEDGIVANHPKLVVTYTP